MSFIAINAKADITINGTNPTATTKKGKITPAQNAMINAWTLSKSTGIFNTLGKCIGHSSTPSNNQVIVTFDRGFFVVYGRLVEVEQDSKITITLPSYSQSGYIVARFDLDASGEQEFQVLAIQTEPVKENLNEEPTGQYDFVLYKYNASPNDFELVPRDDDIYIDDVGGNLANFKQTLYGAGEPLYGYDKNKGTIEERLTNLGFKEEVVVLPSNVTASTNRITRQGNYVIGSIALDVGTSVRNIQCTFPENFRPLSDRTVVYGNYSFTTSGGVGYGYATMQINSDGSAQIYLNTTFNVSSNAKCAFANFGFEAPPITN